MYAIQNIDYIRVFYCIVYGEKVTREQQPLPGKMKPFSFLK